MCQLLEQIGHYGFTFIVTTGLFRVGVSGFFEWIFRRDFMMWIKMVNFCKNVRCPSSTELLAFQTGSQTPKESGAIYRHLIKCDFCTAEVEFYAHYPPIEEKVEIGEIAEIAIADK